MDAKHFILDVYAKKSCLNQTFFEDYFSELEDIYNGGYECCAKEITAKAISDILTLQKENEKLKAKLDILIDEYVASRSWGGCQKYSRKECIDWIEKKIEGK